VRIASLATAPASGIAADVSSPSLGHLVTFTDTEFEQTEKAVARRFVRDTPAVEQAWDVIKETKDHTVIRHFVDRFPSKQRRVVADTRLAALGQKPITVHVEPLRLLDVDETVLAKAAIDPDVMQCFRAGDQTVAECQRAFERFPDIARFGEDIRFTIGFCQAMGNPAGCVPTVKSTWNFPGLAPSSDLKQVDALNLTDALKLVADFKVQQGGGSNASTGVKTTGPKLTGIKTTSIKTTGIKAPTITTPVVRTPNVKVNVRVPNIAIHVR
jgi:hypothetical protein